jgi:hypothetical protein
MLLVFARMATTACIWLDGDLRVELRRDRETVWIDVLTELGAGMTIARAHITRPPRGVIGARSITAKATLTDRFHIWRVRVKKRAADRDLAERITWPALPAAAQRAH